MAIRRCWKADPKQRLTAREVCDLCAGDDWRLVDGADAGAVATFLKQFHETDARPSRRRGVMTLAVSPPLVADSTSDVLSEKRRDLVALKEVDSLRAVVETLRRDLESERAEKDRVLGEIDALKSALAAAPEPSVQGREDSSALHGTDAVCVGASARRGELQGVEPAPDDAESPALQMARAYLARLRAGESLVVADIRRMAACGVISSEAAAFILVVNDFSCRREAARAQLIKEWQERWAVWVKVIQDEENEIRRLHPTLRWNRGEVRARALAAHPRPDDDDEPDMSHMPWPQQWPLPPQYGDTIGAEHADLQPLE
jgi:hypothetical protein